MTLTHEAFDLSDIRAIDGDVAVAARRHWDAIAKPQGSLGVLEDDVVRICALTGTLAPSIERRCVVVLCADNGVIARGVSSSGPEVSRLVAENVARGRSSVNLMARTAGIDVVACDLGLFEPSDEDGLRDLRIMAGTHDICTGPAMSHEQAREAVLVGMRLADELADAGFSLICTGEVGIANTTTATAVACALTGARPAAVCGRGAGLTDDGLARKVAVIERALEVNAPDARDGLDVLAKVGGLDICGMCGLFLGGAKRRIPVVVDGLISAAAAACAQAICPSSVDAMLASHRSSEPAQALLLDRLGLTPAIDAGMRLGEGTGACALVPLLDMAISVFRGTATLEGSDIVSYDPGRNPTGGQGEPR